MAEADGTLIVDEVQRAPDLLREVKASVDRDRRPGRFILTGSAEVLAVPRVAETLAGRMELLRLWPLSQAEIESSPGGFVEALLAGELDSLAAGSFPSVSREELAGRIEAGGFPEAVQRASARRGRWFESYLDTALQREVRDLANVAGRAELPRLMRLLASRATGLLNYAGLSRDLGIPQTTLKRYLALLESTFLVLTVPAWYRNLGKRLIKSPKLILSDSGLLGHLPGAGAEGSHGSLLENFVLMEIVKQVGVAGAGAGVFHYRTADGAEVDAVVEPRGGPVYAIEVKAAQTLSARDVRGLRGMEEALGGEFGAGVVLHAGRRAERLSPRIWALPLAALWVR